MATPGRLPPEASPATLRANPRSQSQQTPQNHPATLSDAHSRDPTTNTPLRQALLVFLNDGIEGKPGALADLLLQSCGSRDKVVSFLQAELNYLGPTAGSANSPTSTPNATPTAAKKRKLAVTTETTIPPSAAIREVENVGTELRGLSKHRGLDRLRAIRRPPTRNPISAASSGIASTKLSPVRSVSKQTPQRSPPSQQVKDVPVPVGIATNSSTQHATAATRDCSPIPFSDLAPVACADAPVVSNKLRFSTISEHQRNNEFEKELQRKYPVFDKPLPLTYREGHGMVWSGAYGNGYKQYDPKADAAYKILDRTKPYVPPTPIALSAPYDYWLQPKYKPTEAELVAAGVEGVTKLRVYSTVHKWERRELEGLIVQLKGEARANGAGHRGDIVV
ncbi:hypothetical protein BJ508DRAFT_333327 [Ascobolus immersus RN42]|uniref:Uncharacterized protein n=1 Tax=Ascobolus immersus RN42 TaxID=1160509 RepID=A0A3N4HP04_ASCIM|nr:hypothetical protein BJ508DRAFT_333327 [Ascobolus immersus RN42]